jgi:hypothetical protein
MITFGSFLALFGFYQTRQYYLLFMVVYGLNAYGTLTKGFPSVVFLVCTVPVFFLYNRDVKRLFTFPHLVGMLFYGLIIGSYFGLYARYADLAAFVGNLWQESASRTVIDNTHRQGLQFLGHIVSFPVTIVGATFPACLLLIFALRKSFLTTIRANPFITFCTIVLVTNILPYWFSPGTRPRYVYMLFPFLIMLPTHFYLEYAGRESQKLRIFHGLIGTLIILVLAVALAMPWIPELQALPNLGILSGIFSVLTAGLFGVFLAFPKHRFFMLLLISVLVRFAMDFTVLPCRALSTHSTLQPQKEASYTVLGITEGAPLYVLGQSSVGNIITFYIERERQEILERKETINEAGYYIIDSMLWQAYPYPRVHTFHVKTHTLFLVKVSKPRQ